MSGAKAAYVPVDVAAIHSKGQRPDHRDFAMLASIHRAHDAKGALRPHRRRMAHTFRSSKTFTVAAITSAHSAHFVTVSMVPSISKA